MSTLRFQPPTDAEKILWAKSEVSFRSEINGILYETNAECKPIFALKRETAVPTKGTLNRVGYNKLVGVIHEPTEILQVNVRTLSNW